LDKIVRVQSDRCKYCNSGNIVKFGTFQGMQRYFCKSCHRKFADNDALPKMKTPIWIISLALNLYYEGMSPGAIQSEINQQHGAIYAQSTIYNWIIRFSEEAVRQAKSFQQETGDKLFLGITTAGTIHHRFWFLDVFDTNSKFLLASCLSETGAEQEAIGFILSYLFTGLKKPDIPFLVVLSDAFNIDSFTKKEKELELQDKVKFVKADKTMQGQFDKILKKRARVVHSFKRIDKARTLTESWRLYYNFIAGNNARGRVSPAQKTGKIPFRKWKDVISQSSI
jgi:transposase-like protein